MTFTINRRLLVASAASLALATALSTPAAAQSTTITFMTSNQANTVSVFEAAIDAFEASHPDIKIEYETRPGGGEGDNIVKTRLATDEITDVFHYNAGSKFHELNPVQNLVPLTDLPWAADLEESFKTVVSANGDLYGIPTGPIVAGGILYNIPIYEELGLEIPKTWDEFMANNAKIKEAGKVPVAQTYATTWTSQLLVLADYFNVQAEEPDFAERYTAGEAKYASTPAAQRSFERLAEVYEAGYLNEDFGAATYEDGVRMVATGEAAHYPMLTFAISMIEETYPDNLQDVGFFAQPGESADNYGLTVWMPDAIYISKTASNVDAAKTFVAFLASKEFCDIRNETVGATGPYLVKGCLPPDDVPPSVSGMLPYFAEGGKNAPALEFLSPLKGPSLEQITVEVGSGIRTPADAAALYDEDVRKQAQQLGLAGW